MEQSSLFVQIQFISYPFHSSYAFKLNLFVTFTQLWLRPRQLWTKIVESVEGMMFPASTSGEKDGKPEVGTFINETKDLCLDGWQHDSHLHGLCNCNLNQ